MSVRSSRRRSGRPPLAEERGAREALLDAAVALFAERGVAATASAHVAERAGVTPAMVHYYFRSRERLIDAVVTERLARFPAYVFHAPLPDVPASARVTAIVHRLFEAARQMPWMPSIWIREIVSDGGMLRERKTRRQEPQMQTLLCEQPADLLPLRTKRATPYLYSAEDVAALMTAARSLHNPLLAATYETLIGLLAVTGLRLGESGEAPDDRVIDELRHGFRRQAALDVRIEHLEKIREAILFGVVTEIRERLERVMVGLDVIGERDRIEPQVSQPLHMLERRGAERA